MVMGILSRLGSQWTAKLRREGQPLSKKNKPALYFQSPDITKCFDSVDLAGVAYPHIRCHTTCAYMSASKLNFSSKCSASVSLEDNTVYVGSFLCPFLTGTCSAMAFSPAAGI